MIFSLTVIRYNSLLNTDFDFLHIHIHIFFRNCKYFSDAGNSEAAAVPALFSPAAIFLLTASGPAGIYTYSYLAI